MLKAKSVVGTKPVIGLESIGLKSQKNEYWNLGRSALVEESLRRGEGKLAANGPLVVETGKHTGRSANDKFIVRDDVSDETVWWGKVNVPMSEAHFAALKADFLTHAEGLDLFIQDLFGGSDHAHQVSVRSIAEFAWHSLFCRTMLIEPGADELAGFDPDYTVVNLPSFKADPARHGTNSETVIAVSFKEKLVLIGGTAYAGENKKSVFSILNYLLPEAGVMPMHCSANMDEKGDTAIFFGLSGTGKTTLSADASRTLIGDDEHGWSETSVFNFEGGCYAKMIRLDPDAEPEIYATTKRYGTILENVVMDEETRALDLNDSTLAENSRGAYPIDFIPNTSAENRGGLPKTVIMLTADAFGVLPPISRLSPEAAMYHFLSGYTAKIAGTEIGITEPKATFSACFGAPFMPRHPGVYGDLLRQKIAAGDVACWLVNTGWSGGPYGEGSRMPIRVTRALLNAALDGSLMNAEMRTDERFGFHVPVQVDGIDSSILDPRSTWGDPVRYDTQADKLAAMFVENFKKFEDGVEASIVRAGPVSA